MMNFRKLIFSICFGIATVTGLSQGFIHPLAIQETENTLIYFMNQDKEVLPADFTYAYKRVAERKRKKKPYRVVDYFPDGSVQMETWMEFPDPISNRYENSYITFYPSGDTNTYIEYDGKSKNGRCRTFYASGQLKLKGEYLNNKPLGLWKSYYESGALKEEGVYLQGEKHGVWDSYHEIGNKSASGMYVKGKKHGKWEQYHSTGDYAVVNHYIDGELNGPSKWRYTSGNASEYGEYVNGKKNGEWNAFFEDAEKKSIAFYEDGVLEGNYLVLGDNREELTVGEMHSNLFTGISQVFSSGDVVLIESYYTEGEAEKQAFYYPDGSPKRVDKLAHDGVKSICYNTAGNEMPCEFESYSLPNANKDLESEIAQSMEYAHVKNYSPRGVYAFDVDTKGKVANPRVVESANADYDVIALDEISRLIWNPGTEAAMKAVFSNHMVVHFDEICKVKFGEFYLNDSLLFKDVIGHDPALDLPDEYPSFRVGMTGLTEYMESEINYPEAAKNENVRGICITKFAIEPSGVLSEIEIVGSVHPLLDYEAVRFLEDMPSWNPGTRSGAPIKIYNHLPIRFTLN
jgi:antitoxin component YwqK of YwqJK toxin-antitoxin module